MLFGWIEKDGNLLKESEVETLEPEELATVGGEFLLQTNNLKARDCYGIYPSQEVDAGTVQTKSGIFSVHPQISTIFTLEEAIKESVRLRTVPGSVVTLSGGVDSTLVAALSGLPAIAVGAEDSHDLRGAEHAAEVLGISLRVHEITEDEVEQALPEVLKLLPQGTPMDIEIALTGWFICSLAKESHATRILTGQAADELFAGYARYECKPTLRAELESDFQGLIRQRNRDSTIASVFNLWYSLPFMDERVVRLAKLLSPENLVQGDLRKVALRRVAEKYLPTDLAWKPKKAMQYGSGITKFLSRIAKNHKCKNTHELLEDFRNV